jgi:putative nucleotidyltransferase with HDIG domain
VAIRLFPGTLTLPDTPPLKLHTSMKILHPSRWKLLGLAFLTLGSLSIGLLLFERVALRQGWNGLVPFGFALLLSAIASILIALRIGRRSSEFAASIASRSVHFAERQSLVSQGTIFEEPATEWNTALRILQDTFLDRQSEARSNYSTLVDLMSMMARAIDERASYLRGHSDRVANYAGEIAREMQIGSAQAERIRLAALVHDIGTVGIEDAIVTKATPLSPEEFEIIKSHTVKGASILRPIEALNDLIPGVELHHESLDGAGYPYCLRGDEIPIMARIIAVADSFDAMTTARPYQSAMDPDYVLEVMGRLAGKRYDPEAVKALTTLVKRGTIVVKNLRAPVSFPRRRVLSQVS